MAISLTDPQAAWVAYRNVRSIFAYHANYLIDNKCGVIVGAEGTRANRSAEHDAAKTMIDRARKRLGLRPRRLAADTAYGAASILKWFMDRGIEPPIPVWDKSRRADGTFSRPEAVCGCHLAAPAPEVPLPDLEDAGRLEPCHGPDDAGARHAAAFRDGLIAPDRFAGLPVEATSDVPQHRPVLRQQLAILRLRLDQAQGRVHRDGLVQEVHNNGVALGGSLVC